MPVNIILRPMGDAELQSTFIRCLESTEHPVRRKEYFRRKPQQVLRDRASRLSNTTPSCPNKAATGFYALEPSIVVILIALFSDPAAPGPSRLSTTVLTNQQLLHCSVELVSSCDGVFKRGVSTFETVGILSRQWIASTFSSSMALW